MKSAKAGFSCARCTVCRFQRLKRQAAATSCTAGQLPWLRRTGLPSRMDCHQLQPRRASGIKSVLGKPAALQISTAIETDHRKSHAFSTCRRSAFSAFKRCHIQSSKDKRHFKWREGRRGLIKAHQGPNCCCLGLAAFVEAWRAFSPCDFKAACAAARRAMGTRKGEHET